MGIQDLVIHEIYNPQKFVRIWYVIEYQNVCIQLCIVKGNEILQAHIFTVKMLKHTCIDIIINVVTVATLSQFSEVSLSIQRCKRGHRIFNRI